MPLLIPPELKRITPFVRRAEELDKDSNPESRLVAFYCRQYAVHTGIPHATSPDGKKCLGVMLGDLEKEKAAMSNFTRDEAKFLCRKFADKVFDKADGEDRAGQANKRTATTFYAAATFLEMMQQFYKEDDESGDFHEEKQRIKYAKWKAMDILKAIKEGREPTPGGYGEDKLEEEDDDDEGDNNVVENAPPDGLLPPPAPAAPMPPPAVETVDDDDDDDDDDGGMETLRINDPEEEEEPEENGTEVELGPPPAYPGGDDTSASNLESKPPLTFNPPVVPAAPPKMPSAPAVQPTPPVAPPKAKKSGGFLGMGKKKKKTKATKAEIADATELTRFALAALEDRDADLAVERLKLALQTLGH
mmetsp:Transcript_6819/g.19969  ORF Transcript_6819/g.19969 Transcript_6819/m.19969 type:complete len:361 (+) Transcript_6819:107-1189(+)|eukprot:CAMPEP_0119552932 /NCGR_PEP_ID=MMETSP1352-20130426/5801_1 /TAXON_ID=265584 /ORGANISM="Stauroneis constricta, Strain CCMP1120" /LENGTH=360 /DNA_ID=CAMNT_0007599249 /DNA_START=362 /DNA_END=1444 /DNA_ORIENTATION=+